jgi:hypothetical protein
MVPLSKTKLQSKFASLANGNIGWGKNYHPASFSPLTTIFSSLPK